MFRQNIAVRINRGPADAVVTVMPKEVVYSPNGRPLALRFFMPGMQTHEEIPVSDILAFPDDEFAGMTTSEVVDTFDVGAVERPADERPDPEARRHFLRTKGSGVNRTQGRALQHLPEGALRFVYTHGLNRRRTKDALVRRLMPNRDSIVIRDISNGAQQALLVPAILSVCDPRTDEHLEDEAAIRHYLFAHGRVPLWRQILGSPTTPPVVST